MRRVCSITMRATTKGEEILSQTRILVSDFRCRTFAEISHRNAWLLSKRNFKSTSGDDLPLTINSDALKPMSYLFLPT